MLVGLWADTMEGRPARWWSVLTVRDDQVAAIEDYTRHRDRAVSAAVVRPCWE